MNEIKKITGYNLLFMLGYCFLFVLGGQFYVSFIVMLLHFIVTIILTFIHLIIKDYAKGKAYLLTSGILLLIGFSTCYGFLNNV